MRRQIVASQRAGESTTRIAERLLDLDRPKVEIPQHVQDLRHAARVALEAGDRNFYEEAVGRWEARIGRLGEGVPGGGRRAGAYTMRSATQQLVRELRSARPDQVRHVVDRWVLERARHQARVVARTETVEAYRDTYRQATAKQPYVKGYRWVLSNRHPNPDVCDLLANQNLHEMGPGGYPDGDVPLTPHPLDLCSQVAIIDEAHFRRQLARERGEPEPPQPWQAGPRENAQQWLGRQPASFQRALLGPTRMRMMANGRDVIAPNGVPIPVHALRGVPPPVRLRGPRVAVSPIIAADRARMAESFTGLPGAPAVPPRIRARKPRPVQQPAAPGLLVNNPAPPPPAPKPTAKPPKATPKPAPPALLVKNTSTPAIPPPPPAPTAPDPAEDLRTATPVRVTRRMPGGGANGAIQVELRTPDGRTISAIYKDVLDESPGLRPNIKAGTYADREAAMYRIDLQLGGRTIVPPTVSRPMPGPLPLQGGGVVNTTRGSLQLFIPGADPVHAHSKPLTKAAQTGTLERNPRLRRMFLLDLISANDDRHAGNYLVRRDGEAFDFVAIDNGLTLPEGESVRFFVPVPIGRVPRALLALDDVSVSQVRGLNLGTVARELRAFPKIGREAARRTLARIRALQIDPQRLAQRGAQVSDAPERIMLEFAASPPSALLSPTELERIDEILGEVGY